MSSMNLAVAELDHVQGHFLSGNRLRNLRQYVGRCEVPIIVRRGKRGLWELVDGFHRLTLARENGEEVILATDDEGTQL